MWALCAPTRSGSGSGVLDGNVPDEAGLIQRNSVHAAFPRGFHFSVQTHQRVVFKAIDAWRVERCLIDQATQVVVIAEPADTPEDAVSRHAIDGRWPRVLDQTQLGPLPITPCDALSDHLGQCFECPRGWGLLLLLLHPSP